MKHKEEFVGENVKNIYVTKKGKATAEQLEKLPKIKLKKYYHELESKGYIIHYK